uniref:Uncharacterized protein n=1 Tax=Steinernema glaseri TaxID=37863 RepID=A0A1I8APL1_9BILA
MGPLPLGSASESISARKGPKQGVMDSPAREGGEGLPLPEKGMTEVELLIHVDQEVFGFICPLASERIGINVRHRGRNDAGSLLQRTLDLHQWILEIDPIPKILESFRYLQSIDPSLQKIRDRTRVDSYTVSDHSFDGGHFSPSARSTYIWYPFLAETSTDEGQGVLKKLVSPLVIVDMSPIQSEAPSFCVADLVTSLPANIAPLVRIRSGVIFYYFCKRLIYSFIPAPL